MSSSLLRLISRSATTIARPTMLRQSVCKMSSDNYNQNNVFDEGANNEADDMPEYESGQAEQPRGGQNVQWSQQPRKFVNKGINRVELLGGVAGDPIYKVSQNNYDFASFNLYTNVDRKDGRGDVHTNTEVHNIVAFGGLAKFVRNNINRGTRIYLIGRLHYQGGQVMADGTRTPRMTSIQAENIYPLAKASSFQAQQGRDFGYGRQQQYQPRRDQMEEEEED